MICLKNVRINIIYIMSCDCNRHKIHLCECIIVLFVLLHLCNYVCQVLGVLRVKVIPAGKSRVCYRFNVIDLIILIGLNNVVKRRLTVWYSVSYMLVCLIYVLTNLGPYYNQSEAKNCQLSTSKCNFA